MVKYLKYTIFGASVGLVFGIVIKWGADITKEGIAWLIAEAFAESVLQDTWLLFFFLIKIAFGISSLAISAYFLIRQYNDDEKIFWFGALGFLFMFFVVLEILPKLAVLFLLAAILWAIVEERA